MSVGSHFEAHLTPGSLFSQTVANQILILEFCIFTLRFYWKGCFLCETFRFFIFNIISDSLELANIIMNSLVLGGLDWIFLSEVENYNMFPFMISYSIYIYIILNSMMIQSCQWYINRLACNIYLFKYKKFTIQNMNFPCKDINFYMFHIPSLSHLLINKCKIN